MTLRRGVIAARCFALLLVGFFPAAPAQATIRYAISVARPEQHFFHVTMTIPEVENEVVVQLPAWNALYQVRDFAHHLTGLNASDDASRPLAVLKLNKETWRIRGSGTITVRYASYWDEPGAFNAQLNASHAFLNLALVLLYVPDRRGDDARIVFDDLPASWRVAVALHPEKTAARQRTGPYVAANYDALVDAPVEMGMFEEFHLGTGGPLVRVVVHGDAWKREQVEEILRRIVSYEIQLMRGAPFDEYVFLYHIGSTAGGSGGGMEHAHSTAIFIDSMGYLENVTAHEFFHLWNVKRIRPQSLEPVDYAGEQWTRSLWFAEGVTSSYASYTLVRTGLWTRRQFYDDLAGQLTDLEARPARLWQSVEQASLDAWFEKYPLYRRPDFSISYYNKGQILGVLLDILIRDATDNRSSLDDVLRDLNDRFARQGRFYQDSADIRASAERIAGRSFEEFFTRYVAGTDELPCAELLARAGLVLKGTGSARAEFGFLAVRGAGAAAVAVEIEPGSTAEQAGVREGDVLLTLNGAAFPRNPIRWLHEHRPGETVRLGFRHENNLKEVSFALSERRERVYSLEEAGNPSEKQRRILDGLLHGTTDGPRP